MKKTNPGRITTSREDYWRNLFNQFSVHKEDHAVSGWSLQGLRLRMEVYKELLKILDIKTGARILDLGCGAGAYSRLLGESGFHVTGVDYAFLVAGQARQRTTSGNVNFISGDACRLPFGDNGFDHVVCIGLFQSLYNHLAAVDEIHRVLTPGGNLCLMTLNRRYLKSCLDRWTGREEVIFVQGQPQARLNTYDPAQFVKELKKSGFIHVKWQPVQIYPEKLNVLSGLISLWNQCPTLSVWTARSFAVTARKA